MIALDQKKYIQQKKHLPGDFQSNSIRSVRTLFPAGNDLISEM